MGCRVLKINGEDLTTDNGFAVIGTGQPAYDDTSKELYFGFTEVTSLAGQVGGENHAKGVFFRKFNIDTETFGPRQTVALPSSSTVITFTAQADCCDLIRLPSTGRIHIFYGDIIGCAYKYSDDEGITWSTEQYPTGSATDFRHLLVGQENTWDDSMYVVVQQVAGGTDFQKCWLYKGAAAGGWTFKGIFDDATAGWIDHGSRGGAPHVMAFHSDGNKRVVVLQRLQANNDVLLRCYYTTDDWATMHTKDIKTFPNIGGAPGATGLYPTVWQGNVNPERVWIMWVESGPTVPWFGYTDDWGANWTIIGTPVAFSGYDWDEAYDRAFFIDYADRAYASVFGTDGLNTKHTAFKNSDATNLSGWSASDCTLDPLTDWVESSGTPGYAHYALTTDPLHSKFFRIFARVYPGRTAPPSAYHVGEYSLFVRDDFVPPPPPPPPPPAPDQNRMYRRGVLQAVGVNIPQRNSSAVRSIEEAVRPPGVN